jgi:uncharacterized protein (PEP-CTERM system associated)
MAITRPRKASAPFIGRQGIRSARREELRSGPPGVRPAPLFGAAVAMLGFCIASVAQAQLWRVVPSIGWETTLTDNVNLAPSGQRESDWVNQFTPSVRFYENGAHTRVAGTITLPILLYARSSENNYVAPQVNVAGTAELVDKFFFVDGTINVSQQFETPFGARPSDLSVASQNRYTAQSYGVAPYVRGNLANTIDYELRYNNWWTTANATVAGGSGNSYTNELIGHVTRQPTPLGWSLEYDRTDLKYSDQEALITSIARARLTYQPDPTLRLSASLGYEENELLLTSENGPTYGAGIEWRPTDRTTAKAVWEHRFFGNSYLVSFDHRTPLSVWSIRASRDITNYPLELAALGAGNTVSATLNSLFVGRIPDPLERQNAVDQLIHDRGLPSVLTSPVTLFTRQITLVDSAIATFGILGVRNSILFTAFHSRNQPLQGSDLPDQSNLLTLLTDNTQVGANVSWSHSLASNVSLVSSLEWARTQSNQELTDGDTTRQYTLRTVLSTVISPRTSIYGGARYQKFESEFTPGYREAAVFAGVLYEFR